MWTYFQNKVLFPKVEKCFNLTKDQYILAIDKKSCFQVVEICDSIICEKLLLITNTGIEKSCTICNYQILHLLDGECKYIAKKRIENHFTLSHITLTFEIPFFLALKSPRNRFPNVNDIDFSPTGILYRSQELLKNYNKLHSIFEKSSLDLNWFLTCNTDIKSNDFDHDFDLFVNRIRNIHQKFSKASIKELEQKIKIMEI